MARMMIKSMLFVQLNTLLNLPEIEGIPKRSVRAVEKPHPKAVTTVLKRAKIILKKNRLLNFTTSNLTRKTRSLFHFVLFFL